ncbi:hypothetical protein ACFYY2_12085 [Streptomyces sp. NPDC001822]|uniref:hypothetical protein n=1 Tax=Streptomyces sp. NPDC001822 TaxID=3364614 RepID=UPI0036AD81B1
MFDYSPAQDNSEAAWIDSVLYSDQTADNFTPYGANGFGAAIYSVVSILDGKDADVYEGADAKRAESEAINAYHRLHGKAEVLVMQDGSNWKWVFGLPKHQFPDSRPQLVEAGFCTDPRCGQVNPLDCFCRYSMTPEEVARWEKYD